jgi:hypothetical protein
LAGQAGHDLPQDRLAARPAEVLDRCVTSPWRDWIDHRFYVIPFLAIN